MTFAKPVFLYALTLIPLAGFFLWWARRRREADLARLGNPALVHRLSNTVNWRGRRWKDALWLVVLALLIVALARPMWGSVTEMVEQEGIQVMVALDVSKSMLAQDIKPDRLSRAKMEIADLMGRLGGDEIGLVLFAGASFVQFPLTTDYGTALTFLDNARPEVISRPGTAIGDAIRTALAGFDMNRSSQKVIVLITDGEDHQGDALAMAEMAADQGVMIYTIGFGSPEGEPIPEYNDRGEIMGYKKDQNGEVVLSKLDEATLQQIAEVGGGQFFHATAGGSELSALIEELSMLQKAELSTMMEIRGIERFQIFLLVALAVMVVVEMIPDRIVRKVAARRAAMHEKWLVASGQ
ncbi:MAG TPA: VWA domain-containing protein [Anaerolineae bacterium]|nr:VWA domain-containing protein [Anaerolineae bacterium]